MFGRALFSSFSLIAIFCLGTYYFHVQIRPKDIFDYQKLRAESHELRSRKAFEEKPALQMRQGVQKDIWFPENGERSHFRIVSAESELGIAQKGEKAEANEILKQIDCSVEDQLGFLADQAKIDAKALFLEGNICLNHPLGTLFADQLKVERVNGKSYSIYLEGEKNKVRIDSTEKNPFSITAKKAFCDCSFPFSLAACKELRFENEVEIKIDPDSENGPVAKGGLAFYQDHTATLYPASSPYCQILRGEDAIDAEKIRFEFGSETVFCEKPNGVLGKESLHFSAQTLLWHKREGTLTLEKEVRLVQNAHNHLEADQGTILLNQEGKPTQVTLQGNVRIQEKESYAAADYLVYNLETKSGMLSSQSSKRVLFWQDGLSLSAEKIKIGPGEGIGNVEGIGDVRFTLDLEEKNLIQDLISKYAGI